MKHSVSSVSVVRATDGAVCDWLLISWSERAWSCWECGSIKRQISNDCSWSFHGSCWLRKKNSLDVVGRQSRVSPFLSLRSVLVTGQRWNYYRSGNLSSSWASHLLQWCASQNVASHAFLCQCYMKTVTLHTWGEVVPFCVVRCTRSLTYFSRGAASLPLPAIRASDGWWQCCSRKEHRATPSFTVSARCHMKCLARSASALSLWRTHTHTHIH